MVIIRSIPDTTMCPVGFTITSIHKCDVVLGPCATSDYDAATPTYATTCLTCFNDAELFTAYKFSLYVQTCVPKVCTSVPDVFSAQAGMCQSCITGFTLTANRSCIVDAGIVVQTTTTNSTNTTTANSTNSTNTTTPANSTTATNTTTPSNSSTPSIFNPSAS
jgi:hypothetical protein